MYTKAKSKDNILLIDVQGWCRTRQEAIEASGAKENGEVATEDALRLKPALLPLRTHTHTHTFVCINTYNHTHTQLSYTHIHTYTYTHTYIHGFA